MSASHASGPDRDGQSRAHGSAPDGSPDAASATSSWLDPAGELREVVGDCVHCGFCLTACPTYQLWGEEMDSPRGRIHLIGQLLDGAQASEAAALHLDRCLGCMACVPACPSGVRYDKLIEAARSWATEPAGADASATPLSAAGAMAAKSAAADPPRALPPRSARQRALRAAIFATFPYPARLRLLLGPLRAAQRTGADRLLRGKLAERLVPEAAAALRVAPGRPAGRRRPRGRLPEFVAARGQRRAVVGMLTGCVQQVFFPQVNLATARVLASEGCDVVIPASQGCCGALSLHDGRRSEAAAFARSLIETFEQAGGRPRRGIRSRSPSPTTTPVIWPQHSGSPASRGSCSARSLIWRSPSFLTRASAVARPASTISSSQMQPGSWEPVRHRLSQAPARTWSSQGTPGVPSRSRLLSPRRAPRSRSPISPRYLTRRSWPARHARSSNRPSRLTAPRVNTPPHAYPPPHV